MRKIVVALLVTLVCLSSYAQDISGEWNGKLKIQGVELRLVFHIEKSGEGYTSTMDSPDQGAKGIPVAKTTYENAALKIELPNLGINYEGVLNENEIFEGTFKQGGLSMPLKLSKQKIENRKPQEPLKPYPYYCEEVEFVNEKDKVKLSGTLTLPQKAGKFPAVVLISGSGAQNRDEEILGHKPFLVLADYLTKKGVAVLRFDDRGTAKSTGDFYAATTFDFATDVKCAVKYLQGRKEIDKSKIGLIGHSEGGVIAAILAAENNDIALIVSMAGGMLRGDKQLLLQKRKIEKGLGVPQARIDESQSIFADAYKMVLNEKLSANELKTALFDYFKAKYPEKYAKDLTNQLTFPWLVSFVRLDPKIYLEKVTCPILAINGEKDLQVSAEENLAVIKAVFKKRANVIIKKFENLNHLFQECKTGLPVEYGTISQTISPVVLEEIAGWVLNSVE